MKNLLAVLATIMLLGAIAIAQNFPTELPKTAKLLSDETKEVTLPDAKTKWTSIGRSWGFQNKKGGVVRIDTKNPRAQELLAEELLNGSTLIASAETFTVDTDESKGVIVTYILGEKIPTLLIWTNDSGQNWFVALILKDQTAKVAHGKVPTEIFGLGPAVDEGGSPIGFKVFIKDENGLTAERIFKTDDK